MSRKNKAKLINLDPFDGVNNVVHDTSKPQYTKVSARNAAQKQYIREILTKDIICGIGSAGSGKALGMDELIFTPTGPVKNKDIRVGDLVCTPDGGTAKVSGVYPQGVKPLYKVVFTDGSEIICSKDHLWEVSSTTYKKNDVIVDTKYIIENISSRLYIKTASPIFFEEKELPIHPYVLGALIGDGGFSKDSIRFTSADDFIIDKIESLLPNHTLQKVSDDPNSTSKYDFRINKYNKYDSNSCFRKLIEDIGLANLKSWEKYIPQEYLFNSVENRIHLLQGLMDTDGTVSNSNKAGHISYCTTSKRLADQVKILIETLGGICIISTKIKKYNYKGELKTGRIAYNCNINLQDSKICFSLPRKLERVREKTKYITRHHIKYVDYIGEAECQCIAVDHPDKLYVTNNCIPTHNTTVAAGMALEMLMEDKTKKIILSRPVTIHPEDQIGFAPGDIDAKMYPFLKPLYDAFRQFISDKQLKELMADGLIEILPFCYMRGSNITGVAIVDETENLSWRQVKLLITRLCKGGKLILCGDPAQSDLPKQKQGAFDQLCSYIGHLDCVGICEFGQSDSQRHPVINTIQNIIDGKVTEDYDPPLSDTWRKLYPKD